MRKLRIRIEYTNVTNFSYLGRQQREAYKNYVLFVYLYFLILVIGFENCLIRVGLYLWLFDKLYVHVEPKL